MQIVFIPGFMGNPHEFLTFADKLPAGAQIITPPGFGCSDAEVTFENVNDWLEEQLIGLKIKECVLYGYSMGGRIATHYVCTAQRPKIKVKGLILESSGIGIGDKEKRKERYKADKVWAERFSSEPMKEVVTDWYSQTVFADLTEEEKEKLISIRSLNNGPRMARTLLGLSSGKMPYLLTQLATLTIPVLYMHGSADEKYTALAGKLSDACPALTVKAIEGCGHNLHLRKPEIITAEISSFLEKLL